MVVSPGFSYKLIKFFVVLTQANLCPQIPQLKRATGFALQIIGSAYLCSSLSTTGPQSFQALGGGVVVSPGFSFLTGGCGGLGKTSPSAAALAWGRCNAINM